jgi:hypothetical protein
LDVGAPEAAAADTLGEVQSAIVDIYRKTPKLLALDGWVRTQRVGRVVEKKQRERLAARLIMALFGGLALVAPMLVMTLHPTRLTTLLTTSICIVVVAVALAFYLDDAQPKDVMAATAAYAAVLVVFVGAIWTG